MSMLYLENMEVIENLEEIEVEYYNNIIKKGCIRSRISIITKKIKYVFNKIL